MKIKIADIRRILEYIYMFILGFIGFSRMSQYVIFNLFHLPFYLIEIFFIPFFAYKWNEYSSLFVRNSRTKRFVAWTMLLIYDVVIGCIVSMNIIDTVTTSRALIYIIYLALIFEKKKKFSLDKMFLIAFGATLGEFFYGIRLSSADIASINTSCLAIMLFIPIIKHKYLLFAGCSLLALVVSINSGYRIGIFVLLLALVECIVWVVLKDEKKTIRSIGEKLFIPVGLIIVMVIVAQNYNWFIQFSSRILGTSQYAIFRVTQRLEALFTGNFNQSNEQLRFEVFKYAGTAFWPSFFPKGLVGKTMGTLHYYYDVPIVYLYDAFGSVPAYVIVVVCSIKGFRCFLGAFKKSACDYIVLSGLMFPILFMCLLTNGSFLYITFQCITTGIFVGEWFAYRSTKMTEATPYLHK